MPSSPDVFIAYGTDTRPLAEELNRKLQDQGIRSWVDFQDLRPGQKRTDELQRATAQANSFLILVGPESHATPWQEAEWRAALSAAWIDGKKRLIPVLFGETESPVSLRNWVHLRVDPEAEPATWTRRVLEALRSRRNRAAHGLTREDRARRDERLNEIVSAVDAFTAREPRRPPVESKG